MIKKKPSLAMSGLAFAAKAPFAALNTYTKFSRATNTAVGTWARAQFASSFAQGGGMVPTMFARTPGEAWRSAFGHQAKFGSTEHIKRLESMVASKQPGAKKALKNATSKRTKLGALGRAGGLALSGGFAAYTVGAAFFGTEGDLSDRTRAVGGAVVGNVIGWHVGSKAGMAIGASIGSVIPFLGTAIGAGVGYLAGGVLGYAAFDEGFQAITRMPDRLVERERKKRNLDWAGGMDAFSTQRAATMRQMSMQAMNSGQMSARSMLGREAVMFHQ